jgi:hypothetical protein
MMGPSIFLPTRNRGGVELHWLTAYGQQITGSRPQGAQRVELKAYTLAGFIPWYDEFEEDVFTDLAVSFWRSLRKVTGRSLIVNASLLPLILLPGLWPPMTLLP